MRCAFTISMLVATVVHAESPTVRVLIDGKEIPAAVVQSNGTVYVPVEAISRALGAKVEILTNQNHSEVQITRPPVAVPRTAPAIKGVVTWIYWPIGRWRRLY